MFSDTLPLRFQDPWQITLPGESVWRDGTKVVGEGAPAEVFKNLKRPQLHIRVRATTSGVLINQRVYPGTRMADSVGYFLRDFGKPYLSRHPKDLVDEPEVQGRVSTAVYNQLWTDKAWESDWKSPRPNGAQGSGFITLGITVSDLATIERVLDKRSLTLSVGFRPTAFFCSVCGHDWIANRGPCGHELGRLYPIEGKKDARPAQAFGITGNLIYDHIADTSFPADPTSQILNSEFQDRAHGYFAQPADQTVGLLEAFAFVDHAGNFWELDMDKDHASPTIPTTPTDPLTAVVDLTAALRVSSKEKPMKTADSTTSTKSAPANIPDSAKSAETSGLPASAAPATSDSKTTTKTEGPSLLDVNGNWTMPDPVDGHVHELKTLDRNGKGTTASSAGAKLIAHSHDIENGRLLPTTIGEGDAAAVSRHPGTWYFDAEGNFWCFKDGAKHRATITSESKADAATDPDLDYSDTKINPEGVETMGEVELADHQELVELFAQGVLKDAVLTTEARKKLPNSAFCGPDRSFPAHDAPHVRNALARLGQGFPKGASSAVKARILACVKRKAKALGVKTGSDATGNEPWADSTSATILKTLGQELEVRNAKVAQLEGVIREKQEELDAIQKENQVLTEQHLTNMIDRVLDLKLVLGKPEVQSIRTAEDLTKARDALAQRSLDSLADSTRDLQLELAQRPGLGIRPDPSQSRPAVPVGGLGGIPTDRTAATNPANGNLAHQTLKSLRS